MPAPLFREWVAYWEAEPFGPAQEDLRAGVVAAKVHNAWCKPPLKPADFFPSLREEGQARPGRKKTPEEMVLAAMQFVAASGGTFR